MSKQHEFTGWRCFAIKLSMVPLLALCGLALMFVIPMLMLAAICMLPWLPVYRTHGFGISLGEGHGEAD